MAFGRVNVGGTSGLKINKVEKIDDKLTNVEASKTLTLNNSFNIKKSIALIESYSKDNSLSTVSLVVNLTHPNQVLVSRYITTGSSNDTEFTVTIIEFDGFKSFNTGEILMQQNDIVYTPLENITNIDNCLIFSSTKGRFLDSYSSAYIVEKKVVMHNGSPHLSLRSSASVKPTAQYIHYYIIEI